MPPETANQATKALLTTSLLKPSLRQAVLASPLPSFLIGAGDARILWSSDAAAQKLGYFKAENFMKDGLPALCAGAQRLIHLAQEGLKGGRQMERLRFNIGFQSLILTAACEELSLVNGDKALLVSLLPYQASTSPFVDRHIVSSAFLPVNVSSEDEEKLALAPDEARAVIHENSLPQGFPYGLSFPSNEVEVKFSFEPSYVRINEFGNSITRIDFNQEGLEKRNNDEMNTDVSSLSSSSHQQTECEQEKLPPQLDDHKQEPEKEHEAARTQEDLTLCEAVDFASTHPIAPSSFSHVEIPPPPLLEQAINTSLTPSVRDHLATALVPFSSFSSPVIAPLSDKEEVNFTPPAPPHAIPASYPAWFSLPPHLRESVRFVFILGLNGKIERVSEPFIETMGLGADAFTGHVFTDLIKEFDPQGAEKIHHALLANETFGPVEILWPVLDHRFLLPISLSASPLKKMGGGIIGYTGFGRCHIDRLSPLKLPEELAPTIFEVAAPDSIDTNPSLDDNTSVLIEEGAQQDQKPADILLSTHKNTLHEAENHEATPTHTMLDVDAIHQNEVAIEVITNAPTNETTLNDTQTSFKQEEKEVSSQDFEKPSSPHSSPKNFSTINSPPARLIFGQDDKEPQIPSFLLSRGFLSSHEKKVSNKEVFASAPSLAYPLEGEKPSEDRITRPAPPQLEAAPPPQKEVEVLPSPTHLKAAISEPKSGEKHPEQKGDDLLFSPYHRDMIVDPGLLRAPASEGEKLDEKKLLSAPPATPSSPSMLREKPFFIVDNAPSQATSSETPARHSQSFFSSLKSALFSSLTPGDCSQEEVKKVVPLHQKPVPVAPVSPPSDGAATHKPGFSPTDKHTFHELGRILRAGFDKETCQPPKEPDAPSGEAASLPIAPSSPVTPSDPVAPSSPSVPPSPVEVSFEIEQDNFEQKQDFFHKNQNIEPSSAPILEKLAQTLPRSQGASASSSRFEVLTLSSSSSQLVAPQPLESKEKLTEKEVVKEDETPNKKPLGFLGSPFISSFSPLSFSGEVSPSPIIEDKTPKPPIEETNVVLEEAALFTPSSPLLSPAAALSSPLPSSIAPPFLQEDLLRNLPVPLLLWKEHEVCFANQALLDLVGYNTVEDFSQERGEDILLQLEGFTPDATTTPPIEIMPREGRILPMEAKIFSALWQGENIQALMLSPLVPSPSASQTPMELELQLQALRDKTKEWRNALDIATDGVFTFDQSGKILHLNNAAEALFGTSQDEAIGKDFTLLFHPDSQAGLLTYFAKIRSGDPTSPLNDGCEVKGQEKTGGHLTLFVTFGLIYTQEPYRYCAVLRDITGWKRTENELTQARRLAESANAKKSNFLAKISHELRTPINAIIGFSELMLSENLGSIGHPKYKEYLDDIRTSGRLVSSLINDLLDLAKIEAGKMELNFAPQNLNSIITSCIGIIQPQANKNRVLVRSQLAPNLPAVIVDERSIQQIVLNLLSNATRFTDAGGQVIVSTAFSPSKEVTIRIRDTGIGMSATEIEAALQPFHQVGARRGKNGGTGLGLPLTKALIEANEASFIIHSTLGEGTFVEITFPASRLVEG